MNTEIVNVFANKCYASCFNTVSEKAHAAYVLSGRTGKTEVADLIRNIVESVSQAIREAGVDDDAARDIGPIDVVKNAQMSLAASCACLYMTRHAFLKGFGIDCEQLALEDVHEETDGCELCEKEFLQLGRAARNLGMDLLDRSGEGDDPEAYLDSDGTQAIVKAVLDSFESLIAARQAHRMKEGDDD